MTDEEEATPPSVEPREGGAYDDDRLQPWTNPPTTAAAPLSTHQVKMRSKFRCNRSPRRAKTAKVLRPICITA